MCAQPKKPPVVIGPLHLGSRESDLHQLAAFKEGLAAFGYQAGQHLRMEDGWADSRRERMQAIAEELAAEKPAVIVPVFAIPDDGYGADQLAIFRRAAYCGDRILKGT